MDFVSDEVQARARVHARQAGRGHRGAHRRRERRQGGGEGPRAAGFAPDEGGAFGHAAAVAELDPGALRAELADDLALERAVEAAWPRLEAADVVLDLLDARPELTAGGVPRRRLRRRLECGPRAAARRGGAPAERSARPDIRARGGGRGAGADPDAVAFGAAPLPGPVDDGRGRPGPGRSGDRRGVLGRCAGQRPGQARGRAHPYRLLPHHGRGAGRGGAAARADRSRTRRPPWRCGTGTSPGG